MKIRKSFLGIFLASFLIGCVSATFSLKEKSLSAETDEAFFPISEETPAGEIPPKLIEKPFTPEIKGLKDFSDNPVYLKYKTKMVDVAWHGYRYRKDEVVAKNGEIWLGLFADESGSYLKNTKVKIVEDDDEGVVIKFKKKNSPLLLLKNAKNLKEGMVVTLFREKSFDSEDAPDNSNTMYRGFMREFQIGERKYTLRTADASTKSGETVLALVLESGNVSQIVTYGRYFDADYLGNLLWVGDLDGDGKLDFYMNINDYEKGYFGSNLYLSSEAEKGKLVKEIAEFYTAGC